MSECKHVRVLVYDWTDTDSDTTIFKYKCRDCGFRFTDEINGSIAAKHAESMKWEHQHEERAE